MFCTQIHFIRINESFQLNDFNHNSTAKSAQKIENMNIFMKECFNIGDCLQQEFAMLKSSLLARDSSEFIQSREQSMADPLFWSFFNAEFPAEQHNRSSFLRQLRNNGDTTSQNNGFSLTLSAKFRSIYILNNIRTNFAHDL